MSSAQEPDTELFRRAMARFATGVVITSCVDEGVDHAMTANAFASVSLDPMLVLVCVERQTRYHEAVMRADHWGVSVLSSASRGAARWLATRGRPLQGQLDPVAHYRGVKTGVALVEGALATLECRTTDVLAGGDHSIVLGEVLTLELAEDPAPALLYYRGAYGSLA
ncbi:MAG: flavin reductase family protein [Dermatophilaceae bacterium]